MNTQTIRRTRRRKAFSALGKFMLLVALIVLAFYLLFVWMAVDVENGEDKR